MVFSEGAQFGVGSHADDLEDARLFAAGGDFGADRIVVAEQAAKFDVMLVDCLTIFVANLLEAADTDTSSVELRIERFLEALGTAPASVVLVSNEVGSGVVPAYAAGRRFRDALGELNQRVAALADNAVLMVSGLPLALKGTVGGQP